MEPLNESSAWDDEYSSKSKRKSPWILRGRFTRWPKGLELQLARDSGLTGRDLRVFISCINLTYGYSREHWNISPEQVSAMTGIQKNHVSACFQKLRKLGYIERERKTIRIIPVPQQDETLLSGMQMPDSPADGRPVRVIEELPPDEYYDSASKLWLLNCNVSVEIPGFSEPHFSLSDTTDGEHANPVSETIFSLREELDGVVFGFEEPKYHLV
ncbi:MAG: replication protein [Candidatus Peribacteraceae bacterium]|nr:replication protein [Candidatus Peribacteraceae bacterium]MDD5074814.1 replication protein [Candidatus Peribacteraceae bacterium]